MTCVPLHADIPTADRPPGTCAGDPSSTVGATAGLGSGESSATIGRSSLVPWAVGIRPYKDATFTAPQHWEKTTCMQHGTARYTLPEWWGLQDPFPELGVVVSALAAGPIASCDGVGDSNASLLMRVARADGVLLKPERPAVAIDALWYGGIFKSGRLQSASGEISQTFTALRVPGARPTPESESLPLLWHYVLGWGIDNEAADSHGGYNVSYTDLGELPGQPLPPAAPTMVAWPEYLDGTPQFSQLREFPTGATDPGLHIPKTEGKAYGEYTLWRTAPILCSGPEQVHVALLGESAKFVSVSAQRITSLAVECGADASRVIIGLAGGPNEEVAMAYADHKTHRGDAACVLGKNGKALLTIAMTAEGDGTSACEPR